MIILTTTSDKLRLRTNSTADIDYYVSWYDRGIDGAMDRLPGTRNTATTADLVPSPASGFIRVLKSLMIRNRHASAQQEITLIHTDGVLAIELRTVVLYPGDTLQYDERNGFTVVPRMAVQTTTIQPAINALNISVLAADVTNSNAVANTIADVTGLSFAVVANAKYYFRFNIEYTSAATATGSRWSISGPGSPTSLSYRLQNPLLAALGTDADVTASSVAYDQPAGANATSANTAGNIVTMEGFIRPSANGTVIARFASEVASSAIVAKAGSFVEWVQVA
jgi:hypothetical protein